MPNRVGSVLHPSVIFKNPLGEKKKTAQHKRSLHKDSFFFIFPLSPALSMPVHVKHCKLKEQIFFFPLENLGRLCVGALSISFAIVLLVILDFEVLTAHLLQHC